MFNPTMIVIDAFVDRLRENYERVYGVLEPKIPNILGFVGRIALENIANSDAPYHDVNHTIMVSEVGQEILRGRQIIEGGVSPADWLHFVVALLCHDIGYVRGVCREDRAGAYVIDAEGTTVTPPRGATDAALTPHHVNRSQLFVRERFANVPLIDCGAVLDNIEHTRFPVPEGDDDTDTATFPGLLRAADLIGQMADIGYLGKLPRLFAEFQESGTNARFGYESPADLAEDYPKFFWSMVRPFLDPSLRYLRVTQEGKLWIASLCAHVFIQEHAGEA